MYNKLSKAKLMNIKLNEIVCSEHAYIRKLYYDAFFPWIITYKLDNVYDLDFPMKDRVISNLFKLDCSFYNTFNSIKRIGVQEPILLVKNTEKKSLNNGVKYKLFNGVKRFTASVLSDKNYISSLVFESDVFTDTELFIISIKDNVLRDTYNIDDFIESMKTLHEKYKLSYGDICNELGVSTEYKEYICECDSESYTGHDSQDTDSCIDCSNYIIEGDMEYNYSDVTGIYEKTTSESIEEYHYKL